jgi:hypothetical protein
VLIASVNFALTLHVQTVRIVVSEYLKWMYKIIFMRFYIKYLISIFILINSINGAIYSLESRDILNSVEYTYYNKSHNYLTYNLLNNFNVYKIGVLEWHENTLSIHLYDSSLKLIKKIHYNYNSVDQDFKWTRDSYEIENNKLALYTTIWGINQPPKTNITLIDSEGKILDNVKIDGQIQFINTQLSDNHSSTFLFYRGLSIKEDNKIHNLGIISLSNNLKSIQIVKNFPDEFFNKYYEKRDLLPEVNLQNNDITLLSRNDLLAENKLENNDKNNIYMYRSGIKSTKWDLVQVIHINEIIKRVKIESLFPNLKIIGVEYTLREFIQIKNKPAFYVIGFSVYLKDKKQRRIHEVFHILMMENDQRLISDFHILPPEYGNQIIGVDGDDIYTVDNFRDNRVKLMKIKYDTFLKNLK